MMVHKALNIAVLSLKVHENYENVSWVLSGVALEYFILKEAQVVNEHDVLVSFLQLLRALLQLLLPVLLCSLHLVLEIHFEELPLYGRVDIAKLPLVAECGLLDCRQA